MNRKENKQRLLYVAVDFIMSFAAFVVFNSLRFFLLDLANHPYPTLIHYLLSEKMIFEELAFPLLMLAVYWMSGYYNKPFLKSRLQECITTFFSAFLNTLLVFILLLTNDMVSIRRINYILLFELFGALFFFTYIGRLLITVATNRRLKRHSIAFRTLIIGNSDVAHKKASELQNAGTANGYDIRGFVEIPGEESSGKPAHPYDQIENIIKSEAISQIIISPADLSEHQILKLLTRLYSLPVSIKIAPATFSYLTYGIRLNDIYGEPLVELTSPNTSESAKNMKRVFDVVCSALALIFLSPIFAAIAIAVKSSSQGPVIYSQERIGYRRKPFKIYKFRSMRTDAEIGGPALATDDDPRITPIGHTLRKYRFDELPQFWNVLKGDMSIVGPRPERDYFISRIMEVAPYYTLLHQVRPGITSWGMVKYGYASTIEQMVQRAQYDLVYLQNMGMNVDLKIIIHTIKTVITGRGK